MGHPRRSRVGSDPGQVHPPRIDLDEHEHVEPAEEEGVHGEEVGGQDVRRLRAQEVAPAHAEPPAGGIEPGPGEDAADRGGRDPDVETLKLALDPQVSPAGVLPRQPKDQRDDVGLDRRAPATPPRIRPAPSDQPAVPAQ